MATQGDGQALARARLNTDTGVIAWSDLARHFARGVVIVLDPELDLVDVGLAMIDDRAGRVAGWRDAGRLRRASDDDARRWAARDAALWALVVAPWVLVQERETGAAASPVVH